MHLWKRIFLSRYVRAMAGNIYRNSMQKTLKLFDTKIKYTSNLKIQFWN